MLAKIQKLGKRLLLWLVRTAFVEGADAPPPLAVRSILVVRTDDRVGNLLLTTPLLVALREGFPGARLGLLCAARRAVVVEGAGLVDELWRFEKTDLFRRPWRFFAFCLRLRRAGYEVAVEAGHWHAFSFTAGMLVRWSGAPVRIGHRRGEAARLLSHAVEKDPAVAYDATAKLELLRPLGIEPGACPPLRTQLGFGVGAGRFRALFGAAPALVVNPGGRKADHRWPVEQFCRAAAEIRERHGLHVWIAWGPGEEALAEALRVGLGEGAVLLPPTDLEDLAAALRGCALFLTNDTGPMHLGVAVGAPTVGVFLAEDWERWAAPFAHFRAAPVRGLAEAAALRRVLDAGEALVSSGAVERRPLDGSAGDP